MLISHATQEDLRAALERVNTEFGGNVVFNNFSRLTDTRHRVTLRVVDSHGPGHRLGFDYRRHMIAACWHVHGAFFDALPAGTVIRTGSMVVHPGDAWQDIPCGSMYRPAHLSEMCECEEN